MEEQIIKLLNKTFTLAAILVLGILVFFVGQLMYQSQMVSQQNANQITVSGEGKVYAKPDVALVNFGVTTQGLTVADVTKTNTAEMNAVIAAMKALKINDKDIQTTSYNLAPQYNYTQNQGQIFQGYSLEQDVQVKVRDFTTIGDVLTQATSNGANLVGDLQFTIDNPEQFQEQARTSAIMDAKGNAANLAKASGISLGKLINVQEGNASTPVPIMYNTMAKAVGAVSDVAPVPTVQPGQQEIDITVNLTYQVK